MNNEYSEEYVCNKCLISGEKLCKNSQKYRLQCSRCSFYLCDNCFDKGKEENVLLKYFTIKCNCKEDVFKYHKRKQYKEKKMSFSERLCVFWRLKGYHGNPIGLQYFINDRFYNWTDEQIEGYLNGENRAKEEKMKQKNISKKLKAGGK